MDQLRLFNEPSTPALVVHFNPRPEGLVRITWWSYDQLVEVDQDRTFIGETTIRSENVAHWLRTMGEGVQHRVQELAARHP